MNQTEKAQSFYQQAMGVLSSRHLPEERAAAAALFRRGWEEERDPNAGMAWAGCLLAGDGVRRDVAACVRVAQELTESGCPLGYYYLSEAARTGKGTSMDAAKAAEYLRLLLEQSAEPLPGVEESVRCQHRSLALADNAEESVMWMRRAAEAGPWPNRWGLSALLQMRCWEEGTPMPAETAALIRRAEEDEDVLAPFLNVLAEMRTAPAELPPETAARLAAQAELTARYLPLEAVLMLLARLWNAADAVEPAAMQRANAALERLLQVMRYGLCRETVPEQPPLEISLCWPEGEIGSYAWVHQNEALQDLCAAGCSYRTDEMACLRITNGTNRTLSRFRVRVCDIAEGREYEAEPEDFSLAPGESGDMPLALLDIPYSPSLYAELFADEFRAELDAENVDLRTLLGFPAPSPAEMIWETGFWGSPVLCVFNPGTEPLRVSLMSGKGVPCWSSKLLPPQEEVRFGWYDMMNLRMPAPGQTFMLLTEGYGGIRGHCVTTERDDNTPGWRDCLQEFADWFRSGNDGDDF